MMGIVFTYVTLLWYGLIPWLIYRRTTKAHPHIAAVVYLGGIGLAIGALSVVHYALLLVVNRYTLGAVTAVEVVLLIGASVIISRLRIPNMSQQFVQDVLWLPKQLWQGALGRSLVTLLPLILILMAGMWIWLMPRQQWDIWITWEQHARFVLRDQGTHWRALFVATHPTDGWFRHTDYPFLWPLALSRLWILQGGEWVWSEIGYVLFFAIATVYTVGVATYEITRSRTSMLFGVLLLASQPVALYWMTIRYAEAPLAMYMILSATLLVAASGKDRKQQIMLGSFALTLAACGVWTKNEGAPYFVIVAAALLYFRMVRALFIGMLASAALLVAYGVHKFVIAPPGDLSLGILLRQWQQLFDASSYRLIGMYTLKHVAIGALGAIAWSALLIVQRIRPPNGVVGALLLLQFFGYVAVYVLTPHGTLWHLTTSFERLWMHLLPLMCVYIASALAFADRQTK